MKIVQQLAAIGVAAMYNPVEIRAAFNYQHPHHGGADWVRLNLTTGPILARRNIAHRSSPIYLVTFNDDDTLRHYMVTINGQLKANGCTAVSAEVRLMWARLIGYTSYEYQRALDCEHKTASMQQLIELYEGRHVAS